MPPAGGGGTEIADLAGAYASLPSALREQWSRLASVNAYSGAVHPLVHRHPVSGRPTLFLHLAQTGAVIEWPRSHPVASGSVGGVGADGNHQQADGNYQQSDGNHQQSGAKPDGNPQPSDGSQQQSSADPGNQGPSDGCMPEELRAERARLAGASESFEELRAERVRHAALRAMDPSVGPPAGRGIRVLGRAELTDLFGRVNALLNEHRVEHVYSENEVLVLDNLAVAHRASPLARDAAAGLRILHRTTVEGAHDLDPPATSRVPPFVYVWGDNPLGGGVWQGSDYYGVGFRWNESLFMRN